MDTTKPQGGTELMYEELMRRLDPKVLEKFSIFNYAVNADLRKRLVFWNQLSFDQDAVQFLRDSSTVDRIERFVFVGNWQAETYRKVFNIPGTKTHVIKNACLGVEDREIKQKRKLKIAYTSTPWRGLDVLLRAWELIDTKDIELHVFSSCKIYGEEFAKNSENQYQHLYEKCMRLENVIYRGSIPNEELRKEIVDFDILAYPNTFEETSCIAVIEALSAGLRVVCSNLGALPETTEGWARMYPFIIDPIIHSQRFAKILQEEIDKMKKGELIDFLQKQMTIYKPKWSWDERIKDWNYLFNIT